MSGGLQEQPALIAAVRDRDALLKERRTIFANRRINDAIQTAIERGEIWLGIEGYIESSGAAPGEPA